MTLEDDALRVAVACLAYRAANTPPPSTETNRTRLEAEFNARVRLIQDTYRQQVAAVEAFAAAHPDLAEQTSTRTVPGQRRR